MTSPTGAKETNGQQQGPRQTDEQNVWRSTRPPALKCYECGEVGHCQSACPNKNRCGLVLDTTHEDTEPIYDSYGEEGDKVDDNVVQTVGDTWHLLVLQCSCTVPRRQDTQWLRTNIFKSTCTIRGRMCTFIIDSWSSKNIIADDAVNKLGLVREQHPAPYTLGWISENSSMRVTQWVLVPFSIGPHYKDCTYCDVAPIDINHVILGRPWEFDRKIIHDGAQNTYSFIWETHQIVLVPTPPAEQIPPPIASTTPPTTLCVLILCFYQRCIRRNWRLPFYRKQQITTCKRRPPHLWSQYSTSFAMFCLLFETYNTILISCLELRYQICLTTE